MLIDVESVPLLAEVDEPTRREPGRRVHPRRLVAEKKKADEQRRMRALNGSHPLHPIHHQSSSWPLAAEPAAEPSAVIGRAWRIQSAAPRKENSMSCRGPKMRSISPAPRANATISA